MIKKQKVGNVAVDTKIHIDVLGLNSNIWHFFVAS